MDTDVRQIITVSDCAWRGQSPFQQYPGSTDAEAAPFWRSRIGLYEAREYPLTPLFHYAMNGLAWACLLAERVQEDGDALIDVVEFALCLAQFQDDFAADCNEERWEHFEAIWPLPSEPVKVFGEWRTCALVGAKVLFTVIWASACNSGDFAFAGDPECQVWPVPDGRVLAWQAGLRSRLAAFGAEWPGEALGVEYNRVATLMEWEYRQYQRAYESDSQRATGPSEAAQNLSGEERVMGVLALHPDWTDKRIAEEAGVHVKTLHRYERFKTARRILKDSGREGLPRGFKTEDGDIEAYQ